MSGLLKIDKNSLILNKIKDESVWKDTKLADIFSPGDNTKMGAGIHEIFQIEVNQINKVDDILYILDGEIKIQFNNINYTYKQGDFAYIFAGTEITIKVEEYVKLIYITFPFASYEIWSSKNTS